MSLSSYRTEYLKKELEAREKEKKRIVALPQDQRMAEKLHAKLCRANHIDGCGWSYESWTNQGHAHKKFLKTAQDLLKVTDEKTLFEVIDLLP